MRRYVKIKVTKREMKQMLENFLMYDDTDTWPEWGYVEGKPLERINIKPKR